MPHFTRAGIYPSYDGGKPGRLKWWLSWGWARKRFGLGVVLHHGLTDGSGQHGRADELVVTFLFWSARLLVTWGKKRWLPPVKVKSFTEIMKEDPRHPIHQKNEQE